MLAVQELGGPLNVGRPAERDCRTDHRARRRTRCDEQRVIADFHPVVRARNLVLRGDGRKLAERQLRTDHRRDLGELEGLYTAAAERLQHRLWAVEELGLGREQLEVDEIAG